MNMVQKIAVILGCTVTAVLVITVWALFHGYFDRGNFQVIRVTQSPQNLFAIVAKRSDNEALSGYQYFLLVEDHVLSENQLRHAYYSNDVIFRSDENCLQVRWNGPNQLVVTSCGQLVQDGQIAVEKNRLGNVQISYENISGSSKD